MLRLIIGAILGAIGAFAYATSPQFQKKLRAKKLPGIRLPKPATMVELPVDQADLDLIDQVICECAVEILHLANQAVPITEEDALVKNLQMCAAAQIYAPEEVPWPPVTGDHPTIHQLWGILGYRVRALVVSGQLVEYCKPRGLMPAPMPPAFPEGARPRPTEPAPLPGPPSIPTVPLPGEPVGP